MILIPGYAAVIGDVIGSRKHPLRAELQDDLESAFATVSELTHALQRLQMTVGDEFQGLYPTVVDALEVTLLLRLVLSGEADLRFGVGWGLLTTVDAPRTPFGQDGPAWWNARQAIEHVERRQKQRGGPRGLRTYLVHPSESENVSEPLSSGSLPPPREYDPAATASINAFLACRDELIGRMDARDCRLFLAQLRGETQLQAAGEEGISAAAASQRKARSGAGAIAFAHTILREGAS